MPPSPSAGPARPSPWSDFPCLETLATSSSWESFGPDSSSPPGCAHSGEDRKREGRGRHREGRPFREGRPRRRRRRAGLRGRWRRLPGRCGPHLAPPSAWVFHAPSTSAKRRNLTEAKSDDKRDGALTAPLVAEQLSSDDELPRLEVPGASRVFPGQSVPQQVAVTRVRGPHATISCARKDSGQDPFIFYDVCASKCTWYKYKEAFSV